MSKHIQPILQLAARKGYPEPAEVVELPSSGSTRIYFRLTFNEGASLIAAYNPDVAENIAWYSFSVHFHNRGFRVPEVYARSEDYVYFLVEDLGNTDLFSLVTAGMNPMVEQLYKDVLNDLINFQVNGIKGLDLDVAYPVRSFDQQSVLWDLNYFKYYFVKPHELRFNERKLEEDFQHYAARLLEPDQQFFLYRDFQTRNILIHEGKPWYIDFQGGRQGPLMYDVASLLYQAKAKLTEDFRKKMLGVYLDALDKILPGEREGFMQYYPLFVFFRLMQVLGAYGFRGLIQRKGHFLTSIPFAIENLNELLQDTDPGKDFPELTKVFHQIVTLEQYQEGGNAKDKLTVFINSFSYKKKGYPVDFSENGGGFVFDCRALPNPGRIAELRNFSGKEKPIIEYLQQQPQVAAFADHAYNLVSQSIENYLERGFTSLQVSFGCTGGKHRSVYNTELLARRLQAHGDKLNIIVKHIQLDG